MKCSRKYSRMVVFFFLVLLFLSSFNLYGQSKPGVLRGLVRENDTKKPLQNVIVHLLGTEFRVKTDHSGHFIIQDIPPGTYSIKFSLSGYERLEIAGLKVSSDSHASIEVELIPILPELREEVTVIAEYKPEKIHSSYKPQTIKSEEIVKTPGTAEDVTRTLGIGAASSRVSDLSNDLIVRGGSPLENGYFVENIQIPNTNHFQRQGSSGGTLSMIDSSLIDSLNFYTAGFPAIYGSRMASIINISLKEGRRDKLATQLNLNTAGFGGYVEGPIFKKKGSWILSLRRNYHDVLAKIIGTGIAPRFGDIHFKLVYDLDAKNKITLLNITGDSHLSYDLETAIEEDYNSFLDLDSNQNTLGLIWFSAISRNIYSNTSLSYSHFRIVNTVTRVNRTENHYSAEDSYGTFNFRNNNYWQLNEKFQLEFGVEANQERIRFDHFKMEYLNRWSVTIPEIKRQGTSKTSLASVFVHSVWSPWNAFRLSVGVRGDYSTYNKNIHLSPRISASWNIGSSWKFTGAHGIYYQAVPQSFLFGNPENKKNGDPFAIHTFIGLRHDFHEGFFLNLDIYRKVYHQLPLSPEDPMLNIMDSYLNYNMFIPFGPLVDTGEALSEGIELFLHLKRQKKLYGTLSISLFRCRYKDLYGIWRNRIVDNRVRVNLIGGYKPGKRWEISWRCEYAGGVPYTPFDIEKSSEAKTGIIDKDQVNALRYPDYISLTLRLDYLIPFSKSSLNFYISAVNLLNRKNVERYYWNVIDNKQDVVYQSHILPLFGIVYSF